MVVVDSNGELRSMAHSSMLLIKLELRQTKPGTVLLHLTICHEMAPSQSMQVFIEMWHMIEKTRRSPCDREI